MGKRLTGLNYSQAAERVLRWRKRNWKRANRKPTRVRYCGFEAIVSTPDEFAARGWSKRPDICIHPSVSRDLDREQGFAKLPLDHGLLRSCGTRAGRQLQHCRALAIAQARH
jgi:hypothetical protein